MMIPPPGRSGPGIYFMRSSTVAFGFFKRYFAALMTSRTLCVGMLVAMPTAIPVDPLTRRLGTALGRTVGSRSLLS